MSEYYVRKTDEIEDAVIINEQIFPGIPIPYIKEAELWYAYKKGEEKPVGFCALQKLPLEKSVFLSRAAVLREHRGNGLQMKFIRARLAWAKKHGFTTALSYTRIDNIASASHLEKAGFRLYLPEWRWAGSDMLYFRKEIKSKKES